MSAMESQITSLTTVYSIVYSGADQRKHQSSTSLAFERGIHPWSVNSPHKGPATRKMVPFDDVIMMNGHRFETFRFDFGYRLSYCAIVMSYGDRGLGQDGQRHRLGAVRHQVITLTNVVFSLVGFCGIRFQEKIWRWVPYSVLWVWK